MGAPHPKVPEFLLITQVDRSVLAVPVIEIARVKARTDERHEALYQKAKERSRIMMLDAKRQAFGRNCIAAIREIAAGHNDAQSLAQSVLESEPKP